MPEKASLPGYKKISRSGANVSVATGHMWARSSTRLILSLAWSSAPGSMCLGPLKQRVQCRLFSVGHTAVNTSSKILVGPNVGVSITLISPLFKAHLSPK